MTEDPCLIGHGVDLGVQGAKIGNRERRSSGRFVYRILALSESGQLSPSLGLRDLTVGSCASRLKVQLSLKKIERKSVIDVITMLK